MRAAALLLVVVTAAACKGEPLPGVCDSETAEVVENEGWLHVESEDELVYDHNPPASGPHFPVWAGWGVHGEVVARGNWVHNLEHGGIVLLIGPDATEAQRQVIADAFEAIPNDPECNHRRVVVTEDPELDGPMAAVAADRVLQADDLGVDEIVEFATACRNHAPESICL